MIFLNFIYSIEIVWLINVFDSFTSFANLDQLIFTTYIIMGRCVVMFAVKTRVGCWQLAHRVLDNAIFL